jgi:sodium-dependent dicarboxylate transporter 2/3/5
VKLLSCVLLAALCGFTAPGPDALRAGLALFVLTGALWVTQALPLAVTAVAVPLLAVLAGVLSPREALAPFAHPVIFLFLGGFALAAALRRQGLDRALAGVVLRLAAGSRLAAVVLLSALTAVVSMWVSNTATAAMMLPIALGLLRGEAGTPEPGPREQAFVLLAVAYGASIGGIGTLVGSPPNAIAAAQAGIGFAQWLGFGLPLVALLWPAMLGVLVLMLRPALRGPVAPATVPFAWTRERVLTVVVFAAAVAGWVGGAPIGRALGIGADVDAVVALAAIVALAAAGVLAWEDVERETRWGVLLLFGGGLALSEAMGESGASRFLAEAVLAVVRDASPAMLLLGVVVFVVFLTELVSNTASAALLLPVVLPVAVAIGLSPVAAAAAIAVSASCAFMLPVATPPNAIVFATERVPQATMMRCGLVLNGVCIAVIAAMAIWVWR